MTPLQLTHEEAIAVLNWHLAYERAVREVVEAVHVLLGDHCHFIPSRWTPTTGAPE